MHAVSALRRVGGFLFSGDGRYQGAARFNGETDGGSVFAIDDDVGKGWGSYDFDAHGREEATRDCDGFDCLVHGAGPYRLNLDVKSILDHASDRSSDRCRRGFRRHF